MPWPLELEQQIPERLVCGHADRAGAQRVVGFGTFLGARRILGFALLPMFIDGITQLAMLRESTNPLRIETGLLAGVAFAFWALSAVESHVLSTA